MSFAGLRACLGVLCALAMLASCAAPRERGGAENQLPVRASVRDVSYPPPSDDGAGWATAVLLGWTGLDVSPSDLAPFFGGDNPHRAAVRAVRRHGRLAYPSRIGPPFSESWRPGIRCWSGSTRATVGRRPAWSPSAMILRKVG